MAAAASDSLRVAFFNALHEKAAGRMIAKRMGRTILFIRISFKGLIRIAD
jgi:hypothetical protein